MKLIEYLNAKEETDKVVIETKDMTVTGSVSLVKITLTHMLEKEIIIDDKGTIHFIQEEKK